MVQLTLFGLAPPSNLSPPEPPELPPSKRATAIRSVEHVDKKRAKCCASKAPPPALAAAPAASISELGVGSSSDSASPAASSSELGVGSSSGGNAGMELALRGSGCGGNADETGDEPNDGSGYGGNGSGGGGSDQDDDEAGEILFENPNLQLPKSGEPFCTKCGYVVDPVMKGVRLMKKSPPTFECSVCNSKSTMLHRMFGSWPMADFKELGLLEQQAFWRSSTSSKEGLKRSVEQHLLTRLVEVQCAKDAGPFLPLSVWSQQGYNVADIERRALFEHHPVLGSTYQVKIHSTSSEKKHEMIRTMMLKLCSRPNKESLGIEAEPAEPAVEPPLEGTASEAASTSSDNNSSSSSSRSKKHKKKHGKKAKHSKKNKKAKKEKKEKKEKVEVTAKDKLREAAKLKAAAEKFERARVVKVKNEAGKVMSKVAPWLTQVEQLLTDPNAAKVPSIMTKKVQESVSQLGMYHNEAKEKLKLKDPLDLTFSIDDVGPVVKEAAGTIKLMNSMLIAVGKI
jgi:hypothetical protein